jgi:hypothetical protein
MKPKQNAEKDDMRTINGLIHLRDIAMQAKKEMEKPKSKRFKLLVLRAENLGIQSRQVLERWTEGMLRREITKAEEEKKHPVIPPPQKEFRTVIPAKMDLSPLEQRYLRRINDCYAGRPVPSPKEIREFLHCTTLAAERVFQICLNLK